MQPQKYHLFQEQATKATSICDNNALKACQTGPCAARDCVHIISIFCGRIIDYWSIFLAIDHMSFNIFWLQLQKCEDLLLISVFYFVYLCVDLRQITSRCHLVMLNNPNILEWTHCYERLCALSSFQNVSAHHFRLAWSLNTQGKQ